MMMASRNFEMEASSCAFVGRLAELYSAWDRLMHAPATKSTRLAHDAQVFASIHGTIVGDGPMCRPVPLIVE